MVDWALQIPNLYIYQAFLQQVNCELQTDKHSHSRILL